MSLIVNFDISQYIKEHEDLIEQLESKTIEAVERVAMQAHLHIVEQAAIKLKGSSQQNAFTSSIEFKQESDGMWSINVPQKMLWIEDGLPPNFDMLPGFLASPKAKSGASGKYLVIPFKHNNAPTQQSGLQAFLTASVKKEMSKRNIPYKAIEKNPDGSPKTGLLHKFNAPTPNHMHEPKKGHQGPSGHPLSIHAKPPGNEGPSGRPYLFGVRVYQKQSEEETKKDVMTFRTASQKQQGQKWIHPGQEPMSFLDEAHQWAQKEWEDKILPEMLKELGIK